MTLQPPSTMRPRDATFHGERPGATSHAERQHHYGSGQMSQTRRAKPRTSLQTGSLVYLLHFHERIGSDKHSIQHYTGSADDLERRIAQHRAGRGARVTQVLAERGIGFDVVAVWPGNREIENALKLHSATRICPTCTPSPRVPQVIQKAIEADKRRRARDARNEARRARAAQQRAEAVAAARANPYQRGAERAERFLRTQLEAGRTADQIEATHDYITGPFLERDQVTPAQAEEFRGYADRVAAGLAQLRTIQPGPAQPPAPTSSPAVSPEPTAAAAPEPEAELELEAG